MNAFDRIAIFRNAIKDRTAGYVSIKVEDLRWMLDLVEASSQGSAPLDSPAGADAETELTETEP